MAKVKILIEGYAKKEKDGWRAASTCVLIKDNNLKILVDPGANEKMLTKALEKEGLKLEDIDFIFLTHYHLDHLLNIRLFKDKDIFDGNTINRGDRIIDYSDKIPGTNIQVIPTPGHASEHCSLIVETEKGKVVIAGDLFWWEDSEEQKIDRESLLEHDDPYIKDELMLKKSREKILEIADFVIPGHGEMFEVGIG